MMNKMYRIITLVILVLFFFSGCKKKANSCDAVQGDWELVE
jgi:PBP1b-binding outer membrane lipoprotein LpoB